MRKTAPIIEEPSNGVHEQQKHGTRHGRRYLRLLRTDTRLPTVQISILNNNNSNNNNINNNINNNNNNNNNNNV